MKQGIMLLAILGVGLSASVRAGLTDDGFAYATPNPSFQFPRDHGSHPEFRIEWWYYTGHLFAGSGRRFGFEATFFRYALHPGGGHAESAFGTNQLYMAHMALTDVEGRAFLYEERLNRDGWEAWAHEGELNLRNGNWSVTMGEDETMTLKGSIRGEVRMEISLEPQQDRVLFGDQGYSRKGDAPEAASWYITFPRLRVAGELTYRGEVIPVTGQAWMDHEISSSQLDPDQVGWDWASIQLDDGRSIMVYLLRQKDRTPDLSSRLTWVGAEGILGAWGPTDFSWTARQTWTSPETGGVYPVDIDLILPDPDGGTTRRLRLRPVMAAQELTGQLSGVPYWEGACDVLDEAGKRIGYAYVELTGYAGDLGDAMR